MQSRTVPVSLLATVIAALVLASLTSMALRPAITEVKSPSSMETVRSSNSINELFDVDGSVKSKGREREREIEMKWDRSERMPKSEFNELHSCKLPIEQIDRDLQLFEKDGIQLSDIVWAYAQGDMARIAIKDNKVYLYRSDLLIDARWGTVVDYLSMIRRLTKMTRIPDVDFIINLLDEPRVVPNPPNSISDETPYHPYSKYPILSHDAVELRKLVPVFSSTKAPAYGHRDIVIPDETYAHYDVIADRIMDASRKSPWITKKNMLVWRGSNTGGLFHYDKNKWSEFPRLELCRLDGKIQRDARVDAGLTKVIQTAEKDAAKIKQNVRMAQPESMEDQLGRKYVLDIDGNTFSERYKKLLLGNSVVFKHASPFVEWYTIGLKPWVHYIPIDELDTIPDRIDWAVEHDAEVKKIAMDATQFALDYLRLENALCYWAELLHKYSKLQKFTVQTTIEFDEVTDSLIYEHRKPWWRTVVPFCVFVVTVLLGIGFLVTMKMNVNVSMMRLHLQRLWRWRWRKRSSSGNDYNYGGILGR